jgi:hypothetical protein
MELKDLIKEVLEQMAEVKGNTYKKSYLVKEIEFELSLPQTETGRIGAALIAFNANGELGSANEQRVRVKLVPKNRANEETISI